MHEGNNTYKYKNIFKYFQMIDQCDSHKGELISLSQNII